MIRESVFYRPEENGFRLFVIHEICIFLRVICEPTTFAGILFTFLKILAALKLVNYTILDVKHAHSTRLLIETTAPVNQEGLKSSLSPCVTHAISLHGGFWGKSELVHTLSRFY